MGFLHHNQIFEVIIEKSDYNIQYLIMMQKSRGLLAHLNCTCGQDNGCKTSSNVTVTQ